MPFEPPVISAVLIILLYFKILERDKTNDSGFSFRIKKRTSQYIFIFKNGANSSQVNDTITKAIPMVESKHLFYKFLILNFLKYALFPWSCKAMCPFLAVP
jgi:hypothetical protein